MTPLIFILITLALLIGFFALTSYEAHRGTRFFAPGRTHLDHTVEHVQFILSRVDLGVFLRDEVRRIVAWVGHALVHLSLQVVRAIERLLTRIVRYLRSKHATDTAPRKNVREFVKTLLDFKGKLKAKHPEPELPEV